MNTSFATRTLLLLTPLCAAPAQSVGNHHLRNVHPTTAQAILDLTNNDRTIHFVAFPPAGGDAYVIGTDTGADVKGTPYELNQNLSGLAHLGQKIRCVAFPPAGGNSWSVISDENNIVNRNVPQSLHTWMLSLRTAGHQLQWVAFPPAGGDSWVLVTDKNCYHSNIPASCATQITALQNAGHKIVQVSFPPSGGDSWTILTDKSFVNKNAPDKLATFMTSVQRVSRMPLRNVAFTPDGKGYALISRPYYNNTNVVLTDRGKVFSMDRFHANMKAQADASGVKAAYSATLGVCHRSYARGVKRSMFSLPMQAFSIYDRYNTAGLSELMTAVAVLRACQNKSVDLNSSIYSFLPTFWFKPASIQGITIKQLLTHQSGFRGAGYALDYAGLSQMVKAGVTQANKVEYLDNANFALLRIVLAYIDGYRETGVTDHGKATADRFRNFIRLWITPFAGIADLQWRPDTVEPTLFYPATVGTSKGTDYGDWSLTAGPAGCHLSVAEQTVFVREVFHSNNILDAVHKGYLYNLGIAVDGRVPVWDCGYEYKTGYFPGSVNGGADLRTIFARFDNGLVVTAMRNGTQSFDIARAYTDAWTIEPVKITSIGSSINNLTFGYLIVKGENLDLVTRLTCGPHVISNTDSSDPTRAWFRVVDDTTLHLHLPPALAPGSYAINAISPVSTSNQVSVQVLVSPGPLLVMPTEHMSGTTMRAYVAKGKTTTAPYCGLVVSPDLAPSALPGVFQFSIGKGFQSLFVLPLFLGFDPNTSAATYDLPTLSSMKGMTLYFQAAYATPLPLAVSNVRKVTFE